MKLKNILLATIVLFSTLAFSSCGDDDDDSTTEGQEQGKSTTGNGSSSDNNNSNNGDNSSTSGNSNNGNSSSTSNDNDWVGDGTYVDLGLPSGLMWATCNVGAEKPEEVGGYFAWGETKTNTEYSWSTYKHGTSSTKITKYNKTDNLTVLDPEDDIATVYVGSEWHTPTADEWQELKDECAWQYTSNYKETGKAGRLVFKKKIAGKYDVNSDAHIFLPNSGEYDNKTIYYPNEGWYWSSSLHDNKHQAYCVNFWGTWDDYIKPKDKIYRYEGLCIRPVKSK